MILALFLAQALVQTACPPQKLQAVKFAAGEVLSFKLDALGAEVGTFEVRTQRPRSSNKQAMLELSSRVRGNAFVATNLGQYDGYAVALVGQGFTALHYREDVDEGDTHRAAELDFPPAAGKLAVRSSKNGEPEALSLSAPGEVRDVLSTLFVLRAQPMKPGAPICMDVYAGRKIWRLTGQVAGRESIDTPLGKFAVMRIDADAVRTDDVKVKRSAHVWVSDDARRLPLVAIGETRGKTLRAQLVAVRQH
jgi:uncharacterized protein DUF3108